MDAHDEQLLERIKGRDELALSTFMDKHRGWVFRRAMKYLHNFEDAEEATMDVFQQIWMKPSWKSGKGTFGAFFNVVVKCRITDVYRRKVRQEEKMKKQLSGLSKNCILDKVDRQDEDMAYDLEREELHDAIVRALELVSKPQHRLAWILRHFEGYQQKEVAKIMDASLASVKIWIWRCKEEMRESLEKENFNEVAGFF